MHAARAVGTLIWPAAASRMIYGGGSIGLMGAAADSALKAGGKVVGVIPRSLLQREQSVTTISPSSMWSAPCTNARR